MSFELQLPELAFHGEVRMLTARAIGHMLLHAPGVKSRGHGLLLTGKHCDFHTEREALHFGRAILIPRDGLQQALQHAHWIVIDVAKAYDVYTGILEKRLEELGLGRAGEETQPKA